MGSSQEIDAGDDAAPQGRCQQLKVVSGKQWKAKAAQRRCMQCIDNEAADAYAAAAGGV